jgi:uncharacterized protein (DUF1501 family)
MKRRDFLRNTIPSATILPTVIGGFSVKAYAADNAMLQALMGATTDTDKVFVIIQLNGGNDGLNMVIPIDTYGSYVTIKPACILP